MRILIVILFSVPHFSCVAQSSIVSQYDKQLADNLGADKYGMKKYVLVILKNRNVEVDDNKRDDLFRGHQENILTMEKSGILVVSGPLGSNLRRYAGIFILNVASVDKAMEYLKEDPAISFGMLEIDLFDWYGSAALPVYLETHNKIIKENP
ncbi:MAG: hypothetical protein ACFHWX_06545 [Bacteroidota bacterium]